MTEEPCADSVMATNQSFKQLSFCNSLWQRDAALEVCTLFKLKCAHWTFIMHGALYVLYVV
jgi:hypothetical protein